MKYFRILLNKRILSLAVFLMAVIASAQTPDRLVQEIRAAAENACVTLTYSIEANVDDVRIEDRGVVTAQDNLWCLKGETIEIYTSEDGTWVLYPESKEAIVEPKWTYDDLESFYRTIISADDNAVRINVASKDLSEKRPVSFFSPQTGTDWVVTDLR